MRQGRPSKRVGGKLAIGKGGSPLIETRVFSSEAGPRVVVLGLRRRILSCKSKTEAEAFSLQSLRKSRTTGGWIGQNHDIVSGGTKIIFVLVSKIEIFKDVVIFAV